MPARWWRLRRDGGAGAPAGPLWSWPVRLEGETPRGLAFVLRPLVVEDAPVFHAVRRANAAWLEPWDATSPEPDAPARSFAELIGHYDADGRAARALPLGIEVDGRLVGQVSFGSIVLGSFRSCFVGYWVSRAVAGQSVVPAAVALGGDHLIRTVDLHRLEVNIRPENTASLAVVRKLGFRSEGLRPHYLHIDGAWRDHQSFALTAEDLAGQTLMERLTQSSQQSLPRHTGGGPAPTR